MNNLAEARVILFRIPNANSFTQSLRSCLHPSDKQREWIFRLAGEQLARERGEEVKRPEEKGEALDFSQVAAMFAHAKTKLVHPKIRLLAENGKQIILSPAPDNGNNPGATYVKVAGEYAGKVTKEGLYVVKGGFEIYTPFLARFAANPKEIAIEYGKKTSNCCFCARTLTADDSVERGYGPICAESYGLL